VSIMTGQRVGFGIIHGFHHFDLDRLAEEARHAEAIGFDLFSVADHLHTEHPTLEPWTALTWAAAATERIQVMSNVLGLPYRAPAVTAKMAETLDRLSGGRLVLGLGVGGYDQEFTAFGLAERTPGQKVSALGEAVEIIRGLWDEPAFSYEGRHFQVREARIEPKPIHPIPIWLGTYGPRALAMTGALADGWVPSLGRLELSQALAMRTAVRASAEAAGRDPDEITCAANIVVAFEPGRSPGSQASWQQLAGSSEVIAEQILVVVRGGFTFLNIALPQPDLRERFAAEVIPLVRSELARSG
jgi:alkanesulfonate monooxygenase SsuD/methylene tetrahydromethanopterin reductase-like flavin-dependent oxidoreductase (luciferase family)